MLPATCALASAQTQTQATLATMAALERLLGFVSAHRDVRKVFLPSKMQLGVRSPTSRAPTPAASPIPSTISVVSGTRAS